MLGFIFCESKRRIDVATAAHIVRAVRKKYSAAYTHRLPPFEYSKDYFEQCRSLFLDLLDTAKPLIVGVFGTDSTAEYINCVVRDVGLDLVQLHGNDSDLDLVPFLHVPVIKTLHVVPGYDPKLDIERVARAGAAAVLLDTGVAGKQQQGGSGLVFDWSVAEGIPFFFIAGGLNPANVAFAVKSGAWAVDVCGGVELEPGKKDHAKVREFVEAVYQAF